jgi:alanine racemase
VTRREAEEQAGGQLTRRSLLGGVTAAALSATLPATEGPSATAVSDSLYDPWIEVHADHLRHNVAEVQRRVDSRPILAVIKNNGYGLGLINVARVLEPLRAIFGFAVVKLHEAVLLRDAGIRKPILLMGLCSEKNLEEAIARRITPMVFTPIGRELERIASKRRRPVPIHICVDTGFGREGVQVVQAPELIRDLARRRSLEIQGIMMTFTEDPQLDPEELTRFLTIIDDLQKKGIRFGHRHAASSYPLFQHPDSFLDMVRPGMALYGVYSEPEFRARGVMDLRPAVSLKARVVSVKLLHKGDSAGYSPAYRATQDVWVALVPTGHADGWPRAAVGRSKVRINGDLFPVIAVSASHSIIEIGSTPRVSTRDQVTFFDWQEGSRPEDVAVTSGTSVYDRLMHLGALLPRRVV